MTAWRRKWSPGGEPVIVDNDLKPVLVLVASPLARESERGAFLRFVREHRTVLRKYAIYSTRGTALSLWSTGLYSKSDVTCLKAGPEGGMVQVAAMVGRVDCQAVILLIDSRDRHHEEVLNRVVKRIASERNTRMITTHADAVRWARFEATESLLSSVHSAPWFPHDWIPGIPNNFGSRPIQQRTLGLTAHNQGKRSLIDFVRHNADLLCRFHRILATGTTGWLLKMVFASPEQEEIYGQRIREQRLWPDVERSASLACGPSHQKSEHLPELAHRLRKGPYGLVRHPELAGKIIPLTPGRQGGDAWMAGEILENRCDTVICFHEALEPVPVTDDISMFEQTCQLPQVFAGCVVNPDRDAGWIVGLKRELELSPGSALLSQRLREKFATLREVVIVENDNDEDSDALGQELCRAGAGYLHRLVRRLQAGSGGRVAVSWGWGMREVVNQLQAMQDADLLDGEAVANSARIAWVTSIGLLSVSHENLHPESIAESLRALYGGASDDVHVLTQSAFVPDLSGLPDRIVELVDSLGKADVILETAAPWDEESGLWKRSSLAKENAQLFPPVGDSDIAGTMGGVFLSHGGWEVKPSLKLVGLDYECMREAVQGERSLVLICGGFRRRPVLRAALWGGLVSVLVTSRKTAEWLLDQPSTAPSTAVVKGTFARVLMEVVRSDGDEVGVIIPAWNLEKEVPISAEKLPESVLDAIRAGRHPLDLLGIVNLSASRTSDLYIQEFELAPEV